MNCPRCKTDLHEHTISEWNHTISTKQCTTCSGIWLKEADLHVIGSVVEPTIWESRDLPSEQSQLVGLYCPECVEHPLMDKEEHTRDHKVILDHCTSCGGIWLDDGEIVAIQKESWLKLLLGFFRGRS